jgi:hypothetical protein
MKQVVVGIHLRRDDIHVDAIELGDLWLSAISVADDQPIGDRDLVLRVAKTRGELLERATFIAVRYGCVVPPLPALQPHWRALLEVNRDNVEMTLKVAASSPKPRPQRTEFSSGAAYLRALHESSAEIDETFKRAAEKAIEAIDQRWLPRDNASIELAALVPRSRVEALRAAAEQLKRDFPRIPFMLSGPWPMEAFASEIEN